MLVDDESLEIVAAADVLEDGAAAAAAGTSAVEEGAMADVDAVEAGRLLVDMLGETDEPGALPLGGTADALMPLPAGAAEGTAGTN